MAGRVILMSPVRRTILQSSNSAEKENRQQPGVILHSRRRAIDCSDSESDEWSSKKRRTAPNYVTNADGGHPKRRVRSHMRNSAPSSPAPPSHVIARRNERERNRVRQVNDSFAILRSRIPDYLYEADQGEQDTTKTSAAKKKLSKVETLRCAVDYIQQLEVLLDIKEEKYRESDDDRFFGSETQESTLRTDPESDAESDIMDLSRDDRPGKNNTPTANILPIKTESFKDVFANSSLITQHRVSIASNSSGSSQDLDSYPDVFSRDAQSPDDSKLVIAERSHSPIDNNGHFSFKLEPQHEYFSKMEEIDVDKSEDGFGHSSVGSAILPPISQSFPTKSLPLSYPDMYAPYGLVDLTTKCEPYDE